MLRDLAERIMEISPISNGSTGSMLTFGLGPGGYPYRITAIDMANLCEQERNIMFAACMDTATRVRYVSNRTQLQRALRVRVELEKMIARRDADTLRFVAEQFARLEPRMLSGHPIPTMNEWRTFTS